MLTAERLRVLLNYDPVTGMFRWKVARGRVAAGAKIITLSNGYLKIGIDGRVYLAHRLAWLHIHGRWPAYQIDHRNGIGDDNRLDNLREATHAQNKQNTPTYKNNTSGFKGVYWAASRRKWHAQIAKDGGKRHLGYFETAEDGHAAYRAAAVKLHGSFARFE